MPKYSAGCFLATAILASPRLFAGEVAITQPSERDAAILTDAQGVAVIKGLASVAGQVKVQVAVRDGEEKKEWKTVEERQIEVHDRAWSARVKVAGPTPTKVRVSTTDSYDEVFLSPLPGYGPKEIKKRGRLNVLFEWEPKTREVIEKIARQTLAEETTPKGEDMQAFVDRVQRRTEELFFTAFEDLNVAPATSHLAQRHSVKMRAENKGIYGECSPDCGDRREDSAKVYVGRFVDFFELCLGTDYYSTPMRKRDAWSDRSEDLAYALARTAAHETGHGLGLAGAIGTTDAPCEWTKEGHYESEAPQGMPEGRFGGGKYLLDRGLYVRDHFRIGQASPTERGPRLPLKYCPFDLSYLRILYPPKESP